MTKPKSLAQWKAEIKEMLTTNDRALVIGIMRIYDHQTADEQRDGQTTEDNGIGFNGCDAELLTSFALQIKQRKVVFDRGFIPLTPKQIEIARKKMLKYAGQLARLAKSKVEQKTLANGTEG